jgi:hypothetical protein
MRSMATVEVSSDVTACVTISNPRTTQSRLAEGD